MALREFRVSAAKGKTIVNPEQLKKNQAAIALLQSWADEDSIDRSVTLGEQMAQAMGLGKRPLIGLQLE